MKNIIVFIILLFPFAAFSQNTICFVKIGCDAQNRLYLTVSYDCTANCYVDLQFFDMIGNNTSLFVPRRIYSFSAGTGSMDIIVSNSCPNITELSVAHWYLPGSGSNHTVGFNGCLSVKKGCCINPKIGNPPCTNTISANITNATCQSDGNIVLNITGGLIPYTYQWSNGSTSGSLENVQPGTYSVTVTDANNCSVSKTGLIITKICSIKDGKVALGLNISKVPDGFNLAVEGGVIANEVKVRLCNHGEAWCDYVFNDKYKLSPLSEVDKYVKANKRLPNMPSTSDIDKDGGYELKKLSLLQQEKIEEIYLHLILLDEKVAVLKDNIQKKKEANDKLKKMIHKFN